MGDIIGSIFLFFSDQRFPKEDLAYLMRESHLSVGGRFVLLLALDTVGSSRGEESTAAFLASAVTTGVFASDGTTEAVA